MARIFLLLLCLGGLEVRALESSWSLAEQRLTAAGGFTPEFISALHAAANGDGFDEIIELNTLLFLKRADYHGVQVTPEAAVKVEAFTRDHAEGFKKAFAQYSVSPHVIASLLWMESRHGQNQGRFLIANVFVALLQTNAPASLKHLNQAATRFKTKLTRADRRGITTRAKKRVQWAVGELRAVEKMWKEDPEILTSLRGSFAGAIGMPQFEPSSFAHYARAFAQSERTPDLTRAEDAILSVACYLKQNGWRLSKRSQLRALLRYNKSHDYARAILKLAAVSLGHESRVPAGK